MGFRRFRLIVGLVLATALLAGWFLFRQRQTGPSAAVEKQPAILPEKDLPIGRSEDRAVPAAVAGAAARTDRVRRPRDVFAKLVPLEIRESEPDAQGRFERLRIVRADYKYPLIRIAEQVRRETAAGRETVLSHRAMVADHVLVKLRPDMPERLIAALAEKHGCTIRKKLHAPGMYLVKINATGLDALPDALAAFSEETGQVQYAEPDYIVYALATIPNDAQFNELWGMHNSGQASGREDADIDAPEAWDLSTGSASILAGVIDTGIDYNHEDLTANAWTNPGETGLDGQGHDRATNGLDDDDNGFVDDFRGWDFANNDNDPYDDAGHGSHCSGTIGAVGNNGLGVAGVCWNVSIVGLKFLTADGFGSTSDAVDAVFYGTRLGVQLTSNSWGGGGFSQALADVIEDAHANGILFIAAAGNDSSDIDLTPSYPASYTNANIIAVAATDADDALAWFSNFGAESVDIGAPGDDILSCIPGNAYEKLKGTSMATPHVSGAAALAWSVQPSAGHLQIRDLILSGADAIPALDGKTVSGARLNVHGTLTLMGLSVSASVPAADEIVFAPPTNFVITLSSEYDTASVQPADLLVNGIPADTVETTSSKTMTFRYLSTPVTGEGLQTMFMAEASVARLVDGNGLREWEADFRYDSLPLAVISTEPPNGSTLTLPSPSVQLNFNEPFAAASISADDLSLSHGLVAWVQVVDEDTVQFGLSGLAEEKDLDIALSAGRITDLYGNPNVSYSGLFHVDIQTTGNTGVFEDLDPAGSLAMRATAPAAHISPAGDTDTYSLWLDAGQTLTLLVAPDSTLQPLIELRGPDAALLGSVQAPTAGIEALLQSLAVTNDGFHAVTVSGSGPTAGDYSLSMVLNAALEEETHGGATNDVMGSAQDLDASAVQLTGNSERGAVLGRLGNGGSTTVTLLTSDFEDSLCGFSVSNNFGSGSGLWHLSTARSINSGHSAVECLYYGMNEFPPAGGYYDTGAANGGAVYSRAVILPAEGRIDLNFNYFMQTENDPEFDLATVAIDDGSGFVTVLSTADGSLMGNTGGKWESETVDLSDFAGNTVVIRFAFDTIDGLDNDFEGWYLDDVTITTAPPIRDWYCFTLGGDQTATVLLDKSGENDAGLEIYDATGGLVCAGTQLDAGNLEIASGLTNSPCYVRVTGYNAEYSLLFGRNIWFDPGTNDRQVSGEDITGQTVVCGALRSSARLFSVDGGIMEFGAQLELDRLDGSILEAVDSDGFIYNPNCAFDGANLWLSWGGYYSDYFSMDVNIDKLDADTGELLDSFDTGVSDVTGLGWLNGELYVTDGSSVHVFDDGSYDLVRVLAPPWDNRIEGLSGDYVRGVIWGVSSEGNVYRVDPFTGEVTASGVIDSVGDENGLAVLGNELFVSETTDSGVNDIAVYGADTLAPARRMAVAVSERLWTLGGEVGTAEDWYTFCVNAGDELSISTLTPAGDPQQPFEVHNYLDPALDLYDPAGTLVDSDDSSGPDTKNALLLHTATETGVYSVRVRSMYGSEGSYLLALDGATGMRVAPEPREILFSEPFDIDPGWQRDGQWAFGEPLGLGGECGHADPESACTGGNVFGYNLAGDYANGLALPYFVTTPAIDCSGHRSIRLSFRRWLGVGFGTDDRALVQVSHDGATWSDVWVNSEYLSISDSDWLRAEYDISIAADGRPQVYLRWGLGPTDGEQTYCGWNIDDVELSGMPLAGALVFFERSTVTALETDGSVPVTVLRTGATNISTTVDYAIESGSAQAGADFTAASGTLWFAAGVVSNTFNVSVTDDAEGEWPETIGLSLRNPSNAVLGTVARATLVISDDEEPPGRILFAAPLHIVRETNGAAMVEIIRTEGSSGTISVQFGTADDTAIAGVDYIGTNGTLVLAEGQTNALISIPILDDTDIESGETFSLALSNATGGALLGTPATITIKILSDDGMVLAEYMDIDPGWSATGQWAFGKPQGLGGSYGYPDPTSGYTGPNVYGYNLEGDYSNNLNTVHYLTTPAINCGEFENVRLRFMRRLGVENGIFDKASVQVSVNGESWTNVWTNSPSAVISDPGWLEMKYDLSTIADGESAVRLRWGMGTTDWSVRYCGWNIDDVELMGDRVIPGKALLTLGSADYEVMEHDSAVTLTVLREWETNIAVSVDYTTFDGSALGGSDYAITTGTLSFAAGVVSNTIAVPINDDSEIEPPTETFSLVLSNASASAVLGSPASALITIADDEQPGTIRFGTASTTVSESAGSVVLTVERVQGRLGECSIYFETRDGTAVGELDYTPTNGTVVLANGQTNAVIVLPILDDIATEQNEIVYVDLSNPGGRAVLGSPKTVSVVILSDDGVILDEPLDEDPGWSASGQWTFGVPLGLGGSSGYPDPTSGYTGPNVYGYNLAGDYANNLNPVIYLTTPPINCSAFEDVHLSFRRWLGVEGPDYDHASVQVSNDGNVWTDVWSNEYEVSDPDWTLVEYDISGVADLRQTVHVRWGMGRTDHTVRYCGWNIDDIKLVGSKMPPDTSRFFFASTAVQADEDAGTATIVVMRDWSTEVAAGVDYATSNGTALAGSDYTTATGTLWFAEGVASNSFTVEITEDGEGEWPESVVLLLKNPTNAVVGSPAEATLLIQDNEGAPGDFRFNTAINLADETGAWVDVTVARENGSWGTVNVGFSTLDGTAEQGLDYIATNGTLTFAHGQVNGNVRIELINDVDAEPGEVFHVILSNPSSGAKLGTPASAAVRILSEDGLVLREDMNTDPGWTEQALWQFGLPQGNGGAYGSPDPDSGYTGANVYGYNLAGDYPNNMPTTYYLTTPAIDCSDVRDVKLNFFRWLGVEDSWYDHANIQVSNDGSTWIEVWANENTVADSRWQEVEYDMADVADGRSSVYVRWGMGKTDWIVKYCGWNIDDVSVYGTPLTNSLISPAVTEAEVSETSGVAVVTLARSGVTNTTVGVGYSTYDGTARAEWDYAQTQGVIWFEPGMLSNSFTIAILDDLKVEGPETLTVMLANPSEGGALGSDTSMLLTIRDDENAGSAGFAASEWSVAETGKIVRLEVLRTGGTFGRVTVDYATESGTAVAGSDYQHVSGVLTFDAGVTSATLDIAVIDDYESEPGETFYVRLQNPRGGVSLLQPVLASISIINDEGMAFEENLDEDPGWPTSGQWEFGVPQGGGGNYGNPDPTSGHTGNNVYGYNLLGDYPNSIPTTYYLTTPAIDCSGLEGTKLNFWRYLGVESAAYDHANVQVSNNGSTWVDVWSNTSSVADDDWVNVEYDISGVADGDSSVYIRWGMGRTDGTVNYCGWNIDDISVYGDVDLPWFIQASAGAGGSVEPSGAIGVRNGGSTNFTVTADPYYYTDQVYRNGAALGPVTAYTWSNVTWHGTFSAVFIPHTTALGTPHWWLAAHGYTNQAFELEELTDEDGDGLQAWQEWIAGTVPTNPGSVFGITGFSSPAGADGIVVHWQSMTDCVYSVSLNTCPTGDFTEIRGNIRFPQNCYTDTVHESAQKMYYRIGVGR